MRKTCLGVLALLLLCANVLSAQQAIEAPLPLDGHITQDGHAVELSWEDASPPRVGSVTVQRRLLGKIGGQTWHTVASGLKPVLRFVDDTTKSGEAYEYKVFRSGRDIVDVGYWATGVEVPAQNFRGTIYVIVDETLAEAIAPRLQRFGWDLTGDGWHVVRHTAPRGDKDAPLENLEKAARLREWLRAQYLTDPFGKHAIVLVGHLPMVLSGKANPDGHDAVPHVSDLFYAEMDGRWKATREGILGHNQLPSNFTEMLVGRIDFSNVSNSQRDREIHLLQTYFDKNHHWRMGLMGDIREAYGQNDNLLGERFALRNVVGPWAVTQGGHHDVAARGRWLWGVDFGSWDGRSYFEPTPIKTTFMINFGSGKQKLETWFNPLTASLAQPWNTIAAGWGGRPTWWLHHMALGGTIGEVHMRTVNNGLAEKPYRETMDYFPTGSYMWRNPIWVNLLGDPTARAFMLAPARRFKAVQEGQDVALSWGASKDPDVIGYRIYRRTQGQATWDVLNEDALVEGLRFTDVTPQEGATYMLRAYGLKQVYAGSFYTYAQGAFAQVGSSQQLAEDVNLVTATGQPVALPESFSHVQDGTIHAIIEGPTVGILRHDGTNWVYTPPVGFTGQIPLRYSVSTPLATDEGGVTITVGN